MDYKADVSRVLANPPLLREALTSYLLTFGLGPTSNDTVFHSRWYDQYAPVFSLNGNFLHILDLMELIHTKAADISSPYRTRELTPKALALIKGDEDGRELDT